MTTQEISKALRQLPMIAGANEWRDRVYITLKGNGGTFAGERNAKVWISRDAKLTVERGKGLTSSEWDSQLRDLQAIVADGLTTED